MRKLLTCAAMLLAATTLAARAEEVTGREEYMAACAACHGIDGAGTGGFADFLTVMPTDLTGLAAANDGEFPFLKTLMIVDGRTGVRGHMAEDMPIWGDRFEVDATAIAGDYGAETMVRGRLLSLVYYLESIQK